MTNGQAVTARPFVIKTSALKEKAAGKPAAVILQAVD